MKTLKKEGRAFRIISVKIYIYQPCFFCFIVSRQLRTIFVVVCVEKLEEL